MTTRPQAIEAMTQKFNDVWSATGYPYVLGNEKFKPPNDTPWARMVIRHNQGTQNSLGPKGCRRFQRDGSMFVQIFSPQETGTYDPATLVEVIQNGFEGEDIPRTSICFLDVSPRENGPSDKTYQETVEIQFRYYEIK